MAQMASHQDAFPVGFHTLVGSLRWSLLPGPEWGVPAGRQAPLSAKPAGRDLRPEQSEFPGRAAPRPGEALR